MSSLDCGKSFIDVIELDQSNNLATPGVLIARRNGKNCGTRWIRITNKTCEMIEKFEIERLLWSETLTACLYSNPTTCRLRLVNRSSIETFWGADGGDAAEGFGFSLVFGAMVGSDGSGVREECVFVRSGCACFQNKSHSSFCFCPISHKRTSLEHHVRVVVFFNRSRKPKVDQHSRKKKQREKNHVFVWVATQMLIA